MKKREARWNTIFNQYLREKKLLGYFELKQTDKDYFPFSKLEIHQYEGLLASEKEGFVWKLSDQDMREKPFDCLSTPPLPSYLVIKFPDGFYLIRIKDIKTLKNNNEMSITLDKARIIAEKIIKLQLK